jgi:CBS domain-containing protein
MSVFTSTVLPTTVKEIMSPDIVTLDPDMTLRDAIGVLDARSIGGAPVVANGVAVGVLSATDILNFEAATPGVPTEDQSRVPELATGADQPQADETHPVSAYFTDVWDNAGSDVLERARSTESPEWDVLAEHVVSEAMSTGVHLIPADASLTQAARYMLDHRLHRLLVTEDRRLAGVVAASDFLRAIAEGAA